MQGLEHHAVQLRRFAGSTPHVSLRQPRKEIAEGRQQQQRDDDVIDHRRGVVVDPLGMEPAVLNSSNLAPLLQARVLVVDLLDQLTVVADDMDFGDGDAHVVEHDALKVKFLDFPLQRLLAPHVVFVITVKHAHQRHFGRLELHAAVAHRVAVHKVESGVVAWLEDGPIALQLAERHHADGIGTHGHADAIVVDDIFREDVGVATVAAGIGQDDVGIATLKGLQGDAPVFHHKPAGQLQLFHHGLHHIDIAARGLPLVVQELIGRLVPVADNDDGPLLGVRVGELLCH